MLYSKNKTLTHADKSRTHRWGFRLVLSAVALVFIAGVAALTTSLPAKVATAAGRSADSKAHVIFTKWVTTPGTAPVLFNMEGVVSGDVGGGKYVGEVLSFTGTADTTKIVALYHLNGGAHQFTARLHIVESKATGDAVLRGKVTEGWMKGAKVRGVYQTIAPCGILNAQSSPIPDTCFQGTLDLDRDD